VIPPSDQVVAALLAALNDGDFHALYGLADRLVVVFQNINTCSNQAALRTIRRRRCLGVLLSFRRIG
jgi:hypothetical protein